MNLAEQKERALDFLKGLDKANVAALASIIGDDFEFEMMGELPGVKPIRGKQKFLDNMPKTLSTMFPKGLLRRLGKAGKASPTSSDH